MIWLDVLANFMHTDSMKKWIWLVISAVLVGGGVGIWWAWQASTPSSEAYRADVIEVLQGQGGLDPGLAFMLKGIRVDLDCQDEEVCTRREHFSEVFDIAEQYEFLIGDYQGRICKMKPSAGDRADHQRLCKLLQEFLKEVNGIKMNASLALSFLTQNKPEEVRRLLRNFLHRILGHRERVLQIEAELRQINWLEPVLRTEP